MESNLLGNSSLPINQTNMKTVLLTLALTFSFSAFSQIAPPRKVINLNLPVPSTQPSIGMGPALMLGGATFIVAGALTPPLMVGWSTTQKQPIYKQIKLLPIVSGSIVFTIGAAKSLTGE